MDEIAHRIYPEMQVSRRRLDGLFVEAGRRAHIMGRIDGSYGGFRELSKEIVNPPGGGTEGVWVEPLRLADYVHFYIWDKEGGLAQVERHCEQYVREVGWSRFVHRFASHPSLAVEKRIWAPRHNEAVVIGLSLHNESYLDQDVRLFIDVRSHLSLGWPRRDAGRDAHRFDSDLGAILAMDESHPEWAALWGSDQEPSAYYLGDFHPGLLNDGDLPPSGSGQSEPGQACSCLQYNLSIPAANEAQLNLVIAGGKEGQAHVAGVYQHVLTHASDLFQERVRHYRAIMENNARIETPDYILDKAFMWAKVGTEDFKHFDPDFGLCYFAGFPAYNFYFASDSFRILHGAICMGDFDDTREILRMILKYQAREPGPDTLPGEIWHEMSTTGDRISPNFCTLDFPPLIEHFYRWTGDRAFLEEVYPNLLAAVEWGYLNDQDGDGLLENGPEGEMADSAFEDTNMEGSHLSPNLAWVRALKAGARLARLIGDISSAERWEKTANELGPRLNQLYWSETERRFEETIRPDGSFDSSWRGINIFDAEIVDAGKAQFGLNRLMQEEACLTDPEAFFSWKEAEKAHETWREHMSWYLVVRGDRARFLLGNHQVKAAVRALSEIARIPFNTAVPGQYPEVIGLYDLATPYVRGCPHQAWSAACGIVYPVIAGLFGVTPEAGSHSVTIDPHIPANWPAMRLTGLRVGDHRLDIAYRRDGDLLEGRLHNDGKVPLLARMGFPLPPLSEVMSVIVDEVSLDLQDPRISLLPTSEDLHVYVETVVPAGHTSTVRLSSRQAHLDLVTDTYLERALPGSRAAVSLSLINKGSRPVKGRLRLDLPEGWLPLQKPLQKVLELKSETTSEFTFDLEVPPEVREGYHTLWARFESSPNAFIAKPMYLPVFASLEIRVDGRGIAKVSSRYPLQVTISNLTKREIEAEVDLDLPEGLVSTHSTKRLACEAGSAVKDRFSVVASQAGEFSLPVKVTAPDMERYERHILKVIPRHRPLVLYSGFLGCPIASDEDLEVVNMPANYAVRKPHVLEQLLPQADVVLTSDQHDAVFTAGQIEALVRYVEEGGNLLLFCYWSSAWGRGFHNTYGNVANTRLAEILPLAMKGGIGQGQQVQLEGTGREVFGLIRWHTCPPYDFNLADVRPGARVWARSESGNPLIAFRPHGQGQVMVIAIDCFGYGNYGTFLRWPDVPIMIRQAVLHLAH